MSTRSILVVAHAWYGDTIGGSFRLASEFAEDLAAAGHDVSYLCSAPVDNPGAPECEQLNGVTIHRYPPPPTGASPLARHSHHICRSNELGRKLHKARQFAAISGHSPLQFLGAIRRLPRRNIFLNYTVHSPFDDEIAANLTGRSRLRTAARWLAVRFARSNERDNCALADRVQCDSQYTLDSLQQKYPRQIADKGCVAPGWVDYARFSSAGSREQARQSLGPIWQSDVPILFTLRRLEARMGLDTFIEAAALVRDRGFAFRVLIGGGGSLRESLEQLVRERNLVDRIFLLGRVPETDLSACYAAADCFVLPTRALECFGLIVLEAFAAGTPVIASNAAAIPEIAAKQGAGWDFEPGHAHQLADRIEAFLTCRLQPTVDLRAIAREYDRPRIFQMWQQLLQDG